MDPLIRTKNLRQIYHLLFLLSALSCAFALPMTAQNITWYPGVDTLSLWGTCTPADFFCRLVRYAPETDRIVIRPQYGEMVLGVPPGGILARYDSAYFETRDSLDRNQYELWYTNHSPYHPEHSTIALDSQLVAFPGPFDLTLLVHRGLSVVDSAVMRFISYQTGLAVQDAPFYHLGTPGLQQNYPNPFNPSTTIKYELPRTSQVTLTVFDILGREVSVLVHDRRDAGVYEVRFEASNFASGVYFYRLQAGDFVATKKLILVK